MNFFLAGLAWLAISFALGVGLFVFAVKGVLWPLALMVILFIVAVGKIGCSSH